MSLTVKDEYLKSIVRQRKLKSPTDIGSDIASCAYAILDDEWREGKPIRMLTVAVMGLLRSASVAEQIDFFGNQDVEEHLKNKKKEETVDKIRQKYGNGSITRGAIISSDIGIYRRGEK